MVLTVAAREGEHAMAFARRINELGFEVEPKEDPGQEERVAAMGSSITDLEKFDQLRVKVSDKTDDELMNVYAGFSTMFDDHTIDPATGALLGRFIAEEKDSARLLKRCYDALAAQERGASADDARRPVGA